MYYVHAVMIGENLQRIWKQQNYVGVEATSYFASEEWKTFLDRIIKPEIAVFDKVLGGKVPKRVLQQKASLEFNDYSENGSFSGLDDELTCPEEQSHHLRIDEEQSPFLTPGSLSVSNISRSQNKHDIEDILRESSPRNLPSPRFNK